MTEIFMRFAGVAIGGAPDRGAARLHVSCHEYSDLQYEFSWIPFLSGVARNSVDFPGVTPRLAYVLRHFDDITRAVSEIVPGAGLPQKPRHRHIRTCMAT
jgi:hypothetical protein